MTTEVNQGASSTSSPLKWFKAVQGKAIKTDADAQKLLEIQNAFTIKALEVLNYVDQDTTSTDAALNVAMGDFRQYVRDIEAADVVNNPEAFEPLQTAFYKRFHKDPNISDEHKLGLEFLTGLVRFSIATRITLKFAKHLHDEHGVEAFNALDIETLETSITDAPDLLIRLQKCSEACTPTIDAITDTFINNKLGDRTYWEAAKDFFEQNPNLDALAKELVSIQYVPEEQTFLGLAQFLHWNGFGGNGRFLEGTRIEPLTAQKLQYHGGDDAETTNFSKRMQVFGNTLAAIKNSAAKAAFYALRKHAQKNTGPMRIYDFCTGPVYGAVKPIGDALTEQKIDVKYTLSDVDGANLSILFKKQTNPNNKIDTVHYVDLNAPLKTEDDQQGKYDLVSAAIGMHQLSAEGQQNAMRHFTDITSTGGYISIPHVNENVHWQLMLITINITDRESFIPDEILHNFKDFAVDQADSSFKVAYPLRQVSSDHTDDTKPHLYDFTMYKVVKMSGEQLDHLQTLWDQKHFDEADQYVENTIGARSLHIPIPENDG
ncbi:MAG: hypothetical protein KAJ86_01790 [Alphaproteobacteria bacterium]|nr:hypothetical protein [Alphaproteobacteria bacterium]